MERRNFLKNSGLACAALTLPSMFWQNVLAEAGADLDLFNIPRPLDTKLNIKPLFGVRIPAELHEGPCRPADPAGWDKAAETDSAGREFMSWKEEFYKSITGNVDIMNPAYVQYAGDHRIDDETWKEVLKDDEEVDLYVLSHYRIPGLYLKTDKDIVLVGNKCATLDVTATINSKGKTAYGAMDYNHLNELIAALKVKKALQHTKLLLVTDGEWDYEYNSVRSNIDTKVLKERFGVEHQFVRIEEMMDEFAIVEKDRKYRSLAKKMTSELMQNAEKCSMENEDVMQSVLYYLTAKKMMQKYNCNGFTATCQEFCVSKLAMKYKVTPCLTHSLLKDEGYISVCEADTNVFLAMALQMYVANRSAYMGNTLVHNVEKNQIEVHHDVPGRKMLGFDQPDLPYRIVSFTERNWGATLRYDFARDKGEAVTLSRMTPKADKVLVVKGKVEGVEGLDNWGCVLRAVVSVQDVEQYFESAQQTGHHFSMVYGDFSEAMERIAEVLDIEMELV